MICLGNEGVNRCLRAYKGCLKEYKFDHLRQNAHWPGQAETPLIFGTSWDSWVCAKVIKVRGEGKSSEN